MSKGSKINAAIALESCTGLFRLLDDLYNKEWLIAGSARRGEPYIGDVDIVVVGEAKKLKEHIDFGGNKKIKFVYNDIPVNMVFTNKKSVGAALMYFTGSKTFNIIMRNKALKRNLLLNEYGLWDKGVHIAGKNEREIFETLGMKYKNPSKRS